MQHVSTFMKIPLLEFSTLEIDNGNAERILPQNQSVPKIIDPKTFPQEKIPTYYVSENGKEHEIFSICSPGAIYFGQVLLMEKKKSG